MKFFAKLFALAAMLVVSTQMARANGLYGTITFGGGAVLGASGITFNPTTDKITITGTGQFSSFTANTAAAFNHNFTFAGITAPGGETLFTVLNSNSTQMLAFTVTSYTVTGTGQYLFYGTLTLYSYNNTTHTTTGVLGTSLTSFAYKQNIPRNDFTGSMAVTPEPSSLLLMGTGLMAVAFFSMRRRKAMLTA